MNKIFFLAAMSAASLHSVEVLNDSNFKESTRNGTVVVDFYATWCGPCKTLAPIFEKVSADMGNKAKFYKVDVDQAPNALSAASIQSLPTIVLFKDGVEVKRTTGAPSESALRNFINIGM